MCCVHRGRMCCGRSENRSEAVGKCLLGDFAGLAPLTAQTFTGAIADDPRLQEDLPDYSLDAAGDHLVQHAGTQQRGVDVAVARGAPAHAHMGRHQNQLVNMRQPDVNQAVALNSLREQRHCQSACYRQAVHIFLTGTCSAPLEVCVRGVGGGRQRGGRGGSQA